MSHYTVRRDDNELRVVVCPKCHGVDIEDTKEVIPYKTDYFFMRLCKCNSCNSYFTFDREDGLVKISEDVALEGKKNGMVDLQEDGRDSHGHSFYILFKKKPMTIPQEQYDKLMGFDENGVDDDNFRKCMERHPNINFIINNKDIFKVIDFESMSYVKVKPTITSNFFKWKVS